MSPSYFMAIVPALCALLITPEATAFVGPHAFMRPSVAARSTAGASLKMSEGAEEVPADPTASDISKGIAHPEAVFTVPENILKVLPHRYPFALVDKVLHFEAGKRIIGIKCITNNEPQFTGHFPDLPIMPGVLQVPCRVVCTVLPSNVTPVARFVRLRHHLKSYKYQTEHRVLVRTRDRAHSSSSNVSTWYTHLMVQSRAAGTDCCIVSTRGLFMYDTL